MIAPDPFLEPRGTPISVYQWLRLLSSLGHEVDLVTYHPGEDARIPGVKIHVRAFQLLPKRLVRSLGWHLMAFAHKDSSNKPQE